jgi:hypothetical protein
MNKSIDVTVTEPAILVRINQLYREGMSRQALYEVTRGVWRVGTRREGAQYALAVYRGEVKEVYRINRWFRAGSTPYKTRKQSALRVEGRWEFIGTVAEPSVREKYFGKLVKGHFAPHSQNPIVYVKC